MFEKLLNSKKNIKIGLNFLSNNDNILSKLITKNYDFSLPKRDTGFEALLKIIISQQLSTSAANSIWSRFIESNMTSRIKILEVDEKLLLSLGLSRQKCLYVKELATQDINYYDLNLKSSDCVINRLTKIKGIGKWTAEIYCLFSLRHANVFPSGDLALQEAIKLLYSFCKRPTEKEVIKLSENWHPWKSLAAHLLWDYYRKIKKKGLNE